MLIIYKHFFQNMITEEQFYIVSSKESAHAALQGGTLACMLPISVKAQCVHLFSVRKEIPNGN